MPRRSPRRRGCCRKRSSRSSCPAPASSSATRSATAPRWPNISTHRSATTTSITTASPAAIRLAVGPLGYNGSKAAMELIAKADVVLALGTRLNPFSTLPGYGIDYWPKSAKIIQVDINPDRIGLTKPVAVGICGDASRWPGRSWRNCRRTPGTPGARSARRSSTRRSPPGCRRSRAWTTRTTIRAPTGTRKRAGGTPTGCRRDRPGEQSRRDCRRMRSSPPTSATTARSATPIRRSRRVANIWRRACSVRAATASRRSSAPRSDALTCRWSVSPAMARSESR